MTATNPDQQALTEEIADLEKRLQDAKAKLSDLSPSEAPSHHACPFLKPPTFASQT